MDNVSPGASPERLKRLEINNGNAQVNGSTKVIPTFGDRIGSAYNDSVNNYKGVSVPLLNSEYHSPRNSPKP